MIASTTIGRLLGVSGVAVALSLATLAHAGDTTPQAQLEFWSVQAGQAGQAKRGELFFNSKHGKDWSCSSCHNAPPTTPGKHASTGKAIKPFAPAFDGARFTKTKKIDKWFRRNCGDVLGRECSAQEKADVIAYALSFK